MRLRVLSFVFLFMIFISIVAPVFAEGGILEPDESLGARTPVEPNYGDTVEGQAAIRAYQQQERMVNFLLPFSLIVSLGIGIILMVFMVRHSPRIPNLIIQGLVFFGSLIWFLSMVFYFSVDIIRFGCIGDPDILEIGWPALFLLVISGFLLYGLIKKQDFVNRFRYTFGLFSGMLIATVLAMVFVTIIAGIFASDGLGFAILVMLLFAVGVVASVILGVIGFFVDRAHNKKG